MNGKEIKFLMYTYDYYIKQFQDAKLFLSNHIETIDDELFALSPASGKWCIGEIIEHLNLTADIYIPAIQRSIENVKEDMKLGGEPFKLGFLMRRFKHYVSPEYNGKLPTNKNFTPFEVTTSDRNKIQDKFQNTQDEFIQLVRKAQVEQITLDKVRMNNPIIKLLKMDANAAFAIMETHQRRHFSQIKEIISAHS